MRTIASFMGLGNCSIPMRLENGKRQLFVLHARRTRRRSCLSMWRSDIHLRIYIFYRSFVRHLYWTRGLHRMYVLPSLLSFVICRLIQILYVRSSQGRWVGQVARTRIVYDLWSCLYLALCTREWKNGCECWIGLHFVTNNLCPHWVTLSTLCTWEHITDFTLAPLTLIPWSDLWFFIVGKHIIFYVLSL